jgi:t-SNARE complex subunit (syntaxin)
MTNQMKIDVELQGKELNKIEQDTNVVNENVVKAELEIEEAEKLGASNDRNRCLIMITIFIVILGIIGFLILYLK